MKVNSTAVMLWVFCAGVWCEGYLIGGTHTAILWGVVSMGTSMIITLAIAIFGK